VFAKKFSECSQKSFEKPSVGRAITFPNRVSRRLSVVVVVARKARSRSLCDSEKVTFISYVFKRGVFFSLLA